MRHFDMNFGTLRLVIIRDLGYLNWYLMVIRPGVMFLSKYCTYFVLSGEAYQRQ
jgi:hypothetical protein